MLAGLLRHRYRHLSWLFGGVASLKSGTINARAAVFLAVAFQVGVARVLSTLQRRRTSTFWRSILRAFKLSAVLAFRRWLVHSTKERCEHPVSIFQAVRSSRLSCVSWAFLNQNARSARRWWGFQRLAFMGCGLSSTPPLPRINRWRSLVWYAPSPSRKAFPPVWPS